MQMAKRLNRVEKENMTEQVVLSLVAKAKTQFEYDLIIEKAYFSQPEKPTHYKNREAILTVSRERRIRRREYALEYVV